MTLYNCLELINIARILVFLKSYHFGATQLTFVFKSSATESLCSKEI